MHFVRFLPLLAACTGPTAPADKATDSGTTPTGPTFTLPPDLVLEDDANYAFDQSWELAASEIKANPAEVFLAWDAKATDAWGLERAPDSYGGLALFELSVPRAEVLTRLADDDLDPVVVNTWQVDVAGATEATLSDLGFDATTLLSEDDAVTWLVALTDDVGARTDLRDGVFLVPRAAQPGIILTIPATAGETEWSVRFGNDELRTDSGHERYTVDFSGLTVDAYGKPFDLARTDRVFVARFDGVDEADDLGADVLDLRGVASGFWTVGTGGFGTADLGLATDEAGAAFPGFTSDTQWLVGGECTTCLGPAPQFLAVVDVRDP
jgi:hypothetical protein